MKPFRLIAGLGLLLAYGSGAAQQWYGAAPVDQNEAVGVAVVMANAAEWADQSVLVSGRITDVCTHRGCWAVFEEDGEMLRISARDHSFALPADARGQAIAHGVLKRIEVSAEQARHLVEDDGANPDILDSPFEYRLVAEGVRLQ